MAEEQGKSDETQLKKNHDDTLVKLQKELLDFEKRYKALKDANIN